MQVELVKIIESLGEHKSVYLQGPMGSGKTWLARLFAAYLAQKDNWQNLFVIYYGFSFKPDANGCARSQGTLIREAFYTFRGEPQGWSKCEEAIIKLKLLSDSTQTRNLYESAAGWQVLHQLLNDRNYKLIIVLDDYDFWRNGKTDDDFALALTLEKQGIPFLLTSRNKAIHLDTGEQEGFFLENFKFLTLALPDDLAAKEIIKTCKENLEKETGKFLPLNKENDGLVLGITGNYPALIERLLQVLTQNAPKRWLAGISEKEKDAEVTRLINKVRIKKEFTDYVKCIWDSLEAEEKQILALLTIAQKSDGDPNEIYEIWQRRRGPSEAVPSKKEFSYICNSLENERLLLVEEKSKLSMPSLALADYIWSQQIAKELALKTDTPVKVPLRFNIRVFGWLWVLGTIIYFILFFNWRNNEIPEWVLLGVLAPAFLYFFFFYAIRKLFHT